jgi:hypothetical protein
MNKAIDNSIPLDVDLYPNRDKVYSGICIKETEEIFIFICFNEETKIYDGYAIIRSKEIEKFRYWDEEEMADLKKDNHDDFMNVLPLSKMNTFYDCLNVLIDQKLISIFTEKDNDSFYVGKILDLNEHEVRLKLINEDSEWIDNESFKINEITYIGFATSYEEKLQEKK